MNPVMKGYISYSDLKNGTLNLYDLYILNEAIESENKYLQERTREIKRNMALKKGKK